MDYETLHFLFFVNIRVHPNGQALYSELICEYVSNFHCTGKLDTQFQVFWKTALTSIITPHIGGPKPVNLKKTQRTVHLKFLPSYTFSQKTIANFV